MPIINLPANQGAEVAAGTILTNLTILVNGPSSAQIGIQLDEPPPPYAWIIQGPLEERNYYINGHKLWVFNRGPSAIQAFWNLPLHGVSPGDVPGVTLISKLDT